MKIKCFNNSFELISLYQYGQGIFVPIKASCRPITIGSGKYSPFTVRLNLKITSQKFYWLNENKILKDHIRFLI